MNKIVTVKRDASRYVDEDNPLYACEREAKKLLYGSAKYDFRTRWKDEQKKHILLDIPSDLMPVLCDNRTEKEIRDATLEELEASNKSRYYDSRIKVDGRMCYIAWKYIPF